MSEEIRSGAVLIREGVSLPDKLRVESIAWMPGWRIIKGLLSYAMSREVQHAGWAFLFVGDALKGSAIGAGQASTHRALRGILSGLKSSRFNAVEVTAVVLGHFLGVPYVTLTAYSRHLHEGAAFGLLRPVGTAEGVRPS